MRVEIEISEEEARKLRSQNWGGMLATVLTERLASAVLVAGAASERPAQ